MSTLLFQGDLLSDNSRPHYASQYFFKFYNKVKAYMKLTFTKLTALEEKSQQYTNKSGSLQDKRAHNYFKCNTLSTDLLSSYFNCIWPINQRTITACWECLFTEARWSHVTVFLYSGQSLHQALISGSVHQATRLILFPSLMGGMEVQCKATPSIKFTSTHLYTWVERGTVKVKCLVQKCPWPGLEPRLFNPESSVLTI